MTVNELIVGVNIALETLPVDECTALDVNDDGAVTVNELVQGVNNALEDCGGSAADSTHARSTSRSFGSAVRRWFAPRMIG